MNEGGDDDSMLLLLPCLNDDSDGCPDDECNVSSGKVGRRKTGSGLDRGHYTGKKFVRLALGWLFGCRRRSCRDVEVNVHILCCILWSAIVVVAVFSLLIYTSMAVFYSVDDFDGLESDTTYESWSSEFPCNLTGSDNSISMTIVDEDDKEWKELHDFEDSFGRTFVRPPGTKSLNCQKFFNHDRRYVYRYTKKRLNFTDPPDESLPMDCESIRMRNYFPRFPATKIEADYPLAEARVVFQDYVFVEMELASGYAPQNWYCFAVDTKASPLFHRRMNRLANCLPNVLISDAVYPVDSAGHNMTSVLLDCLEVLNNPTRRWKYVALLQNHDVSVKTNREMVEIYRLLNGANDVEMTRVLKERIDFRLDWSFRALHLFRNVTRNRIHWNGFPPVLIPSKGYVESSYTREFVDYILNVLDLDEFKRRVEVQGYGTDETMFPTLNAADALAVPGGFTHACINRGFATRCVTRTAVWFSEQDRCPSRMWRHWACIFGVENLYSEPNVSHLPEMFVNKFMPEYDMAAITCWHEELFRRAYREPNSQTLSRLNRTAYTSLPHVIYQQLKKDAAREGRTVDLKDLNCAAINAIEI